MNYNIETGISGRTTIYYRVFCRLAKLIQVKSATLQRFQLAFEHLLLLEENSRLHPIFQDFAFNFHTFSRSGKVVRKFSDFFKNSRLCTNPELSIDNKFRVRGIGYALWWYRPLCLMQ